LQKSIQIYKGINSKHKISPNQNNYIQIKIQILIYKWFTKNHIIIIHLSSNSFYTYFFPNKLFCSFSIMLQKYQIRCIFWFKDALFSEIINPLFEKIYSLWTLVAYIHKYYYANLFIILKLVLVFHHSRGFVDSLDCPNRTYSSNSEKSI